MTVKKTVTKKPKIKPKPKEKRKVGRPSSYTIELAKYICQEIETSHRSIQYLCDNDDKLPEHEKLIYRWMNQFPEFRQMYMDSKEKQGLYYSNKVMETIWECREASESVAKANLILKGSQWHLARLSPKVFGEKKEIDKESTEKLLIDVLRPLVSKHEKDY